MSVQNLAWKVVKTGSAAVLRAILISDSAFFGVHVSRELLKKEVEVYYFKNQPQPDEELKKLKSFPHFHLLEEKKLPLEPDYIFQINARPAEKGIFSPLQSFQLAYQKKAKFLFATVCRQDFPKVSFQNAGRKRKVDWRLVHFDFVYGPSKEENSLLEKFFSQIKQGKILVAGTGEDKIYPLHVDDFVKGLMRAMFLQDSREKLYRLTGLEKTTLLDFAWRVRRISGRDLEIVFIGSKEASFWSVDSSFLERIKKSWWWLVYKPRVDFSQGIRLTLSEIFGEKEQAEKEGVVKKILSLTKAKASTPETTVKSATEKVPVTAVAKETKTVPSKTAASQKLSERPQVKSWLRFPKIVFPKLKIRFGNFFLLLFLFLISLLIIASPLFLFLGFGLSGFARMQKIETKIERGEFEKLAEESSKAKEDFLFSRKILWQFAQPISFVGGGKSLEKLEEVLNLAISLTESLETVSQALLRAKNLREIVFQDKIANPYKELEKLQVELAKLDQQLAFVQLNLDKNQDFQPPFLKSFADKAKQLRNQLPSLRQKVGFARRFLSLLPEFLAFQGKKTYLLLLQNNMELRPTGGFIGSYALLTFGKGRLLDFLVEDVYSADGQLKGHVEPPQALKKHLGQANWYLRDSNFSPDFPTAARQAEWFLEKETGQRVDGTIALDLDFVKSLLQIIGPVKLPEYKDEITASNLFERAEYYAEIDFFPGSTQKRSFLSSLSSFLFEKLKTLSSSSSWHFLEKLQENLAEKDVMVFLHDKTARQKIRFLGWNGEVRKISFSQTSQFKGPGLIDYLMIVDANLGVNKANYFLTREIDYEATILKKGKVVNRITLVYHNASPSQSWPGGTYKNYLRILLADDVKKISVKEAKEGEGDYKIRDSKKIDKEKKFGKSVFGFLVEVLPGESKKLVVTYERGEKLPVGQALFDYVFYLQKQSGTKDDPLTVKVNFPGFLKPIKIMPQGSWKPQNVVFQTEFNKDHLFAVEFSH